MYCTNCGMKNDDNVRFCARCGMSQIPENSQPTAQPNAYTASSGANVNMNQAAYSMPQVQQQQCQQQYNGQRMSYLEFFDKFASKKTKGNANYVGIVCVVTAIVSVVLAVMSIDDITAVFLSIIDLLFYGVFAVLNFKMKKWQVSLPVCIYGGFFTALNFGFGGTPTGIFALICSILATKDLKKVEAAYKQYGETNILPQSEI